MIKYVAFLRGINVGGNNPVKMDDLKKAFESLGFKHIKTILASGNVLFEGSEQNITFITEKIEKKLKEVFGHEIGVITRTVYELQHVYTKDPFKEITVTKETRLYVTFLSSKPKSSLKIPYESTDKNFKIIRATENELFSVLTLVPDTRTIDLMTILEKEFEKKITTRNWNTIMRILKASSSMKAK